MLGSTGRIVMHDRMQVCTPYSTGLLVAKLVKNDKCKARYIFRYLDSLNNALLLITESIIPFWSQYISLQAVLYISPFLCQNTSKSAILDMTSFVSFWSALNAVSSNVMYSLCTFQIYIYIQSLLCYSWRNKVFKNV